MKHLTLAAAGLSALIAGPAIAGGVVETAPAPAIVTAPAPVMSSTNWTGPSVGVQLGYADVDTNVAGVGDDGALLGLRAYYDYDFGDFIVGGGLQYDAANIGLSPAIDLDAVARLGLRAGVDLGTNWIYATAGVARAYTSGGGLGDSDGWFAGLGYEVFVANNVTIGAEVLYHEFDDFDLAGADADATTAAVSVNFRF